MSSQICYLVVYNFSNEMKYKKMNEQRKAELRTAALLIRFRTAGPTTKSRKYVSYKRIAAALNMTPNEVQHICRKAIKKPKPITNKKLALKLD